MEGGETETEQIGTERKQPGSSAEPEETKKAVSLYRLKETAKHTTGTPRQE